jgi:hypothetical protein
MTQDATIAVLSDYEQLDRWRQWQARYATSSRTGARQAQILFAIIVTAVVGCLGLRALWSVS